MDTTTITAKQLSPVKETLGVLVKDILEKVYRLKVRERDLSEKLFGVSENEGPIAENPQNIEQDLFVVRNILATLIERLDKDIENLV